MEENEIKQLLRQGTFYRAKVVQWPYKDRPAETGISSFLFPIVLDLPRHLWDGSLESISEDREDEDLEYSENRHHHEAWFPSVLERIEQEFGTVVLPLRSAKYPELQEGAIKRALNRFRGWWNSQEQPRQPSEETISRAKYLEDAEYSFGRDGAFPMVLNFEKDKRVFLELRGNDMTFCFPNDHLDRMEKLIKNLPGIKFEQWTKVGSTEEMRELYRSWFTPRQD